MPFAFRLPDKVMDRVGAAKPIKAPMAVRGFKWMARLPVLRLLVLTGQENLSRRCSLPATNAFRDAHLALLEMPAAVALAAFPDIWDNLVNIRLALLLPASSQTRFTSLSPASFSSCFPVTNR
ncbi:hypothetical protein ACNKHS_07740 [Shigella flexneri]